MTAISPGDEQAPSPRVGRGRRIASGLTIVLTVFGLAMAGTMGVVLSRERVRPEIVDLILLANLAFILLITFMIARKVWRLMSARKDRAAGAALHLRLTGIFAIVAFGPTVIIAVYATISVNAGIEAWFSERVGTVVRNSLTTAQAYANEHRRSIQGEVLNMANDMNRAGLSGINEGQLVELLRGQQQLRRFPEAYLIDGARNILHRGEFSYTFTYELPTEEQMTAARLGNVPVVEDTINNELRALVQLSAFYDMYLYVSRQIDGDVLRLLDETEATVEFYEAMETQSGQILSRFALVYLAFSALVISIAVWFGLWVAERLSRPIGALASAAEKVGQGDLDIRVPEDGSRDEIALLSSVFNRMTSQVKGQRDALVDANRESEQRRNFIETVLSGVSAGVVGIGESGVVEMMNDAAREMLSIEKGREADLPDEIRSVYEAADATVTGVGQAQVTLDVNGSQREFLVRVAARSSRDHSQGYVMTIDDLTALVSAQREAAWGDVARRIAHEIKNPLTPIQLAAERLRRKYGALAGEDRANFDQYADVIIRQTGDIRRMVDEFSKFARMPQPEARSDDLAKVLQDAVLLQRSAGEGIEYVVEGADAPCMINFDAGMITQALTNVLKNAAEAIEGRIEQGDDSPGRIVARLGREDDKVSIEITDNGVGLPVQNRNELTEPYVTTRVKGTGLGLAIVKKIAEQHGGVLTLASAETNEDGRAGAVVTITLPVRGGGA